MCQFLSAIATRDGRLLFTELDSHEEIIKRAGLRDVDLHLRYWVRVEQCPADIKLRVDETSTPSWFVASDWQARIKHLRDTLGPAETAYGEALATARTAFNKACAPARTAYNKACASIEGYVPARGAS